MHSSHAPETHTQPRAQMGALLPWMALLLGLVCVAAVLLAALGYRAGRLPLGTVVQSIRWAATGALVGAVVAALALGLEVARQAGARRKALWTGAGALALNALVAAPPLYLYVQAKNLPPIHDISTDTRSPPRFVAIVPLRSSAPNPVDYDPANAAEQQRGYPDIGPLVLANTPPAQSFAHAERAARALGWDIVSIAPEEGRLEATDTTPLLGFKDDIVVRVRASAQGQGSVVDVRSTSRMGVSDIGANAKRIRAFLRQLRAEAQ